MGPFSFLQIDSDALPVRTASECCPICGGSLYETRGVNRCRNCQFTCCLGCDGEYRDGSELGVAAE